MYGVYHVRDLKMVTENLRQTHRKEADAMQDAPCVKCKANLIILYYFYKKR